MEDPGYPYDPRTGPYRNGLLSGGPPQGGIMGGLFGLLNQPSFAQQMANTPTLAQIRDGSADISAPMALMMGMTSPSPGGVRVYRGAGPVDRFTLPGGPEQAVWFTDSIRDAVEFARMRGGPQQYLYSAQLPAEQIRSFPWRDFADSRVYMPDSMRGLLDAARGEGARIARIPGIQNFEHGPLSTSYAVFDPELIRILNRRQVW